MADCRNEYYHSTRLLFVVNEDEKGNMEDAPIWLAYENYVGTYILEDILLFRFFCLLGRHFINWSAASAKERGIPI